MSRMTGDFRRLTQKKPSESARDPRGAGMGEGGAFTRGLACLVDESVSGALTDMHLTPSQKVHADRLANTDAPALADSMAYALERVFKVGP